MCVYCWCLCKYKAECCDPSSCNSLGAGFVVLKQSAKTDIITLVLIELQLDEPWGMCPVQHQGQSRGRSDNDSIVSSLWKFHEASLPSSMYIAPPPIPILPSAVLYQALHCNPDGWWRKEEWEGNVSQNSDYYILLHPITKYWL